MSNHVPFASIGQYRNVIHEITCVAEQVGNDAHGDPIYDKSRLKPTLNFTGTVKLHGSNTAVCRNGESGLWVQSRESIITPTQDYKGFAKFVEARKDSFEQLLDLVYAAAGVSQETHTVSLFGEWRGGNIQPGVGIAKLSKSFFIFAAQICDLCGNEARWIDTATLTTSAADVYNIASYPTWQIEIDFNDPASAQARLEAITAEVEKQCPVAKAFGHEGIGEGVVWSTDWNGTVYRFKVKGAEHSVVRAKEAVAVAPEVQASEDAFLTYAVTENRFRQGLGVIFPDGGLDIKKMGLLIRWMTEDVTKEEADTMAASGIDPKKVGGKIAERTRSMFFAATGKTNVVA